MSEKTERSTELDELRERVEALEARIARLGTAEDDTYEYLCAREFQLQDRDADGIDRMRAMLHTYDIESEQFAELSLFDPEGRPRLGFSVSSEGGGVVMLDEQGTGLLGIVQANGHSDLSLSDANGTVRVALSSGPDAAGLLIRDSQGRPRAKLSAGGQQEDRVTLLLNDGEGEPLAGFTGGAVGGLGLVGWAGWANDRLKGA